MRECLILIVFLGLMPNFLSAQCLHNPDDKNIILVYEGKLLEVSGRGYAAWPQMPKGDFVAYLYRDLDSAVIQRVGFIALKNLNDTVVVDLSAKLLIVVQNLTGKDLTLEYNDLAVFMENGKSYTLSGLALSPEMSAIVWLSWIGEKGISEPVLNVINFELINGVLKKDIYFIE